MKCIKQIRGFSYPVKKSAKTICFVCINNLPECNIPLDNFWKKGLFLNGRAIKAPPSLSLLAVGKKGGGKAVPIRKNIFKINFFFRRPLSSRGGGRKNKFKKSHFSLNGTPLTSPSLMTRPLKISKLFCG